jgi:hypothetical protein
MSIIVPQFVHVSLSEQIRTLETIAKRAYLPIIPHGIWSTLCQRGIVWVHQNNTQWIDQPVGRRSSNPIGILLIKPKTMAFTQEHMPNFASMWHDVAQFFNKQSLGECDESDVLEQSMMIKARFGLARLEAAQFYFREAKRIQQMALRLQHDEGSSARVMYTQNMIDMMKVATRLGYDAYAHHITSIQTLMHRFLPSTTWMPMSPLDDGYVMTLDDPSILKQALPKLQRYFHHDRVLYLKKAS